MPGRGRGRGVSSSDYKGELRRPGERRTSNSQDGDQQNETSAAKDARGNPESSAISADSSVTGSPESSAICISDSATSSPINKADKGEEMTVTDEKKIVKNKTPDTQDSTNVDVTHSISSDINVPKTNPTQGQTTADPHTPEGKSPISVLAADVVVVNSKLSPLAPAFVPRSQFQSPLKPKPSHLSARSSGPDSVLIDCVKDTIYQLSLDPGELEAIVEGLVETMEGWISQDDTLTEIADIIVNQCVTEPNFTYTGARLCDYLDKNMNLKQDTKKKFRVVFVTRCKQEHLGKDALKTDPSCEPRLLGFAMFLAELFCNFKSWNYNEPFAIFHKALLELLEVLIAHGSDDALYCIGRVMKMTGYLIDDPLYKDLKDREHKVDKIFDDIKAVVADSKTCARSTKTFLESVLALRAKNWGKEDPQAFVAPDTQLPEAEGTPDSPQNQQYVYYTPNTDGFTSGDQWSTTYYDDNDDYQQYGPDDMYQYDTEQYYPEGFELGYEEPDDPEFDAELEADFEKFLAMQ